MKVRSDGNECFPGLAGARRYRSIRKCCNGAGRVSHVIERPLSRDGTNSGNQVHQAEAGNAVSRVLDEAQQCQHVLDVRGIEELETAELDEGDVAPDQLDFQRTAVAGRPEQYSLLLQERAGLTV